MGFRSRIIERMNFEYGVALKRYVHNRFCNELCLKINVDYKFLFDHVALDSIHEEDVV